MLQGIPVFSTLINEFFDGRVAIGGSEWKHFKMLNTQDEETQSYRWVV